VFVFAAGKLTPSADCKIIRDARGRPRWTPVEVVMPASAAENGCMPARTAA
jgi:hypothetical protein